MRLRIWWRFCFSKNVARRISSPGDLAAVVSVPLRALAGVAERSRNMNDELDGPKTSMEYTRGRRAVT